MVLAVLTIAIFLGYQAEKSRVAKSGDFEKVEIVSNSSEIPRSLRKKYLQEKRYALVIGNNSYSNMATLKNAINDSRAIHKSLEKLNFEVFYLENGSKRDMRKKIDQF